MSAILGVFGTALPDAIAARMLRAMRARGADQHALWHAPDATLAVARHDWECDDALGGQATVVDDGDCVLVADASIYYRTDLQRKLASAGVPITRPLSSSELIAAAYRTWGVHAARELEGDFAFILWDRRTRRVTCSRDFGGKRPLYYAHVADTFVVASTASAVVEHPNCSRELNLSVLADIIAQHRGGSDETAYRAVRELLAGSSITVAPGVRDVHAYRNWDVPAIGHDPAPAVDEVSVELRTLLQRAAAERLAPRDSTAVWMNGNWSSCALFALSKSELTHGDGLRDVVPVSISHSDGAARRDDELVAEVAGHWYSPVEWLRVDDISSMDVADHEASACDLPLVYVQEHWCRALAARSRATGAPVALDGTGPERLFPVLEPDANERVRKERWLALRAEWKAKRRRGPRAFGSRGSTPELPERASTVADITDVGRRSIPETRARSLPPWVDTRLLTEGRAVRAEAQRASGSNGEHEWYRQADLHVESPSFARIAQRQAALSLECGLELRSPLCDRRVVEFALSRRREGFDGSLETKRALRHAMKGLLPDHLLAPRLPRGVMTTAYIVHQMRRVFPATMDHVLEAPVLSDLGVVHAARVREAWRDFVSTGRDDLSVPLYLTLHVELWLRARMHTRPHPDPGHAPRRVPAGAWD